MKLTITPLALSIALLSSPSFAAGTLLNELGHLGASTAGAGVTALSEGAESAYTNPAAMSLVEQSTITGTLQAFDLKWYYQDIGSTGAFAGGEDGSNIGGTMPVASFYWVTPVNDKWHVGMALASQGGSAFDYGDWRGSSLIKSAELTTVQINTSASYKINNNLAIGLGIVAEYATIVQDQFFAGGLSSEYEADSTELGLNIGLHYSFDEDNMLGMSARSALKHNLEGDMSLIGGRTPREATTKLGLYVPAQIKVSGTHGVSDKTSLLWSFGWEDWSKNQTSDLTFDELGKQLVIDRDWEDSYSAALGLHYQVAKQWRLEFGIGYETSPLDDITKQYPDLPVDRIVRVGSGATYQASQNLKFNFFIEYLDLGQPQINYSTAVGRLSGEYDIDAGFIGATVHWIY